MYLSIGKVEGDVEADHVHTGIGAVEADGLCFYVGGTTAREGLKHKPGKTRQKTIR